MDARLLNLTILTIAGQKIWVTQEIYVPWTCTNCYVKSYYTFLRKD